jgi:hypothetical protein
MALNLTKVYSQRSNAQADVRKAVKKNEVALGAYTVVPLSGGFKIVKAQAKPDIIDLAMDRGLSPAEFADLAKGKTTEEVREAVQPGRWPSHMTPGLARLRASSNADAIRESVLADNEKAAAEVAAERAPETAKAAIQRVVQTAIANGSPVIEEQPATTVEQVVADNPVFRMAKGRSVAAEPVVDAGVKLLTAIFHSPALRDTPEDARVGVWVDYRTIKESDRPHGLNTKSVPGYMTGLSRRGLVECRMDKPGKYSARLTPAGFGALRQEGGH